MRRAVLALAVVVGFGTTVSLEPALSADELTASDYEFKPATG